MDLGVLLVNAFAPLKQPNTFLARPSHEKDAISGHRTSKIMTHVITTQEKPNTWVRFPKVSRRRFRSSEEQEFALAFLLHSLA